MKVDEVYCLRVRAPGRWEEAADRELVRDPMEERPAHADDPSEAAQPERLASDGGLRVSGERRVETKRVQAAGKKAAGESAQAATIVQSKTQSLLVPVRLEGCKGWKLEASRDGRVEKSGGRGPKREAGGLAEWGHD
jgi:hypothetical protein